jgi:tetratricopeptide (TPR) repeat protein
MIASVRQPLNDYDSALGQGYSNIAFMRSKLPDWEGTEKACARAMEEYDKTIATYRASGSSDVRFSKAMAMYWLALAYANQRKQDLALSAADNAFQYTAQLHNPAQLARMIADLGLQEAKASRQQELITTCQNRLSELPADPCPAPNIHNPNCITPVPDAPGQPAR